MKRYRTLTAVSVLTLSGLAAAACGSPAANTAAQSDGSRQSGGTGTTHRDDGLALSQNAVRMPTGPHGIAGRWRLAWKDGFNLSSLVRSRWQPGWFGTGVTKPVNSAEHDYSSANVTESGGTLNLKRTSRYGALVSSNPDALGKGKGYQWTGPAVMEARVYLPGSGKTIWNWPGVWSDGQNWPANGEIDLMEGLGGRSCFHVHTNAGGPGGCLNTGPGWHTYAAYWTGTTVKFYYDGHLAGSEPYKTGNSPQYAILMNTEASSIGGPSHPDTMKVDWVRVWKPVG